MCGLLHGLQKAIKVTIEIPIPGESETSLAPKRKIKLKKKSDKKNQGLKPDEIDDVELGDTLYRDMLPDMNSRLGE